ncbi:MAG TPA: sigma-70 family RNA polymerase sigma factor [Longimicrobiales bacterium]
MAQQGDARAFDSLVRRFQDSAVACARAYLRDRAAAEDAAQEAFVQAWLDLPTLANPAAFGAWLRRIVFKHCDRARRSARPALPLPESEPDRSEHEPLPALERAERAARVHDALWSLPDLLREATLLYYLAGYDVKEIAAVLEVPPSTVKNRLHIGGWGWLSHAATLWKVAGDRERTLMLLREARAHDDRDMAALFAERPEFADVREDPDFLAAVSRSG